MKNVNRQPTFRDKRKNDRSKRLRVKDKRKKDISNRLTVRDMKKKDKSRLPPT